MQDEILARLEKLIDMANILVGDHPTDARLKLMLINLEEVKSEISKPELKKDKLRQLSFGVTRIFTEMLDYEITPFGEELKKFLIEFHDFYETVSN
ncbi:MAG: hypothetical protein ABSA51_10365 [Anaerolineaceae bacterium]|jgi:hypothetical protein